MAIPNGVTKYVISGSLSNNADIFNTAFWVDGFTEGTFPSDGPLVTPLPQAWEDLFDAMQTLMGSSGSVTGVDAYRYEGGVAVQHSHSTVARAGAAPIAVPPQNALVCTLRTANATRRGRGRMYFPATAQNQFTSAGLLVVGGVNALVTALAEVLALYSTTPNTAVVVSQTGGTLSPITSVDADYVCDTQRRRRNKLKTARFSATV